MIKLQKGDLFLWLKNNKVESLDIVTAVDEKKKIIQIFEFYNGKHNIDELPMDEMITRIRNTQNPKDDRPKRFIYQPVDIGDR